MTVEKHWFVQYVTRSTPPVFIKKKKRHKEDKRKMKKGKSQKFRALLPVHYRERRVLVNDVSCMAIIIVQADVLVNAVWDTESDSTFILKEICEEHNTETQPTRLRLSTILSHESLIDSERVSSVNVRGYNSNVRMPIPLAYTSLAIPADESHRGAFANNWGKNAWFIRLQFWVATRI